MKTLRTTFTLELLLGLLLIITLAQVEALQFNEIMYDPPGNDNNREYIEILTEENLSGWIVGDLASNDTLLQLQEGKESGYALIVEEGFNFTRLSCAIYSAGATIGNNLNNGGDTIFLHDPNASINLSFDDTIAKDNGFSRSFINGSWHEGRPTPCEANIINYIENNYLPNETEEETNQTDKETNETEEETNATAISLKIILPETIYQGLAYTSLFKVSNDGYQTGDPYSNVTVTYNVTREGRVIKKASFEAVFKSYKQAETGSVTLNEIGDHLLCGNVQNRSICKNVSVVDPFTQPCDISLELELKDDALLHKTDETIRFYNRMTRHDNETVLPPYIIKYEIENLDGETMRITTTENLRQKSWTPKIERELDVFILKNSFDLLACNNSNEQTGDERLIVVKGVPFTPSNESTIEIVDLNIPEAGYAYGDEVKVTVALYKGGTRKYAVKAWVQGERGKVSEVTTFYAKQPLASYEMVLPIRLDQYGKSGQTTVIVEGLGLRSSRALWIQGKEEEPPIIEEVIVYKEAPMKECAAEEKQGEEEAAPVSPLTGNAVYTAEGEARLLPALLGLLGVGLLGILLRQQQ